MFVRRSVLALALVFVLVGAVTVTSCQPSDAPDSAPAEQIDQPDESYPGGTPPSMQDQPQPVESYPEGRKPTDEGIPEFSYPAPGDDEASDEASDEDAETEEQEGAAAPDDSSGAVCVNPQPGMAIYVDDVAGFCFQYPEGLEILPPGEGAERRIVTIAPPGSAAAQPSVSSVVFSVEALGPVDLETADELADEYLSSMAMDVSELETSDFAFGSDALGVVVDGIDGPMKMRQGFLVRDGQGYAFLIMPWDDETQAELQDDANSLWQVALSTLAFTDEGDAQSE